MTHAQVSEPRGFFGWVKPGSYYCTSGKNSAKCLGQNMECSPVFIKDFGCIGSGDPNSLAYGTNCQIKGNGSFKCNRGPLSCFGHFNSDVLCSIKFDSLYEKIQYVAKHGLDSL